MFLNTEDKLLCNNFINVIPLLRGNSTLEITQQHFKILYGSDVLGNSANMCSIVSSTLILSG